MGFFKIVRLRDLEEHTTITELKNCSCFTSYEGSLFVFAYSAVNRKTMGSSAQERVSQKELLTWPFNRFNTCLTTDSSTPSWTVNLQFTHQIEFLSFFFFLKLVLFYLKHYPLETRARVYSTQTRSYHKFQDGNKGTEKHCFI